MDKYNVDEIQKMSYTDFVATVNQWNVPPGSYSTVNEWAVFGHVTDKSRVLEVACTTGFSGRELAKLTGCQVHGIDISKKSVEVAKKMAERYAPECKLTYECKDLFCMSTEKKYTHIIIGAAIQFFENRDKVIEMISNLLDDGGIILASPYYLKNGELPQSLINTAKKVININPTNFGYNTAMNYYKGFELIYQSRKDIVLETREEMEQYTKDTVEECVKQNNIQDEAVERCLFDRLYEIKDVCNQIHSYHEYSVIVLRYTKNIFPKRFVELF